MESFIENVKISQIADLPKIDASLQFSPLYFRRGVLLQVANVAAARVKPFRVIHVSLTPAFKTSRFKLCMFVQCEEITYLLFAVAMDSLIVDEYSTLLACLWVKLIVY